jgi:hypothetical protein
MPIRFKVFLKLMPLERAQFFGSNHFAAKRVLQHFANIGPDQGINLLLCDALAA